MSRFSDLEDVERARKESGQGYYEFLRASSLSAGLWVLPAGSVDDQTPHREDEVYYVLAGRARIRVGEEDRGVRKGSCIFVERGVEHHFHSIEEDLRLLVFFAPAYSG